MIACPASGDTHIDFKMVDCPFHNCPDFIERVLFVRVSLDSREHPEVHVFIGIGSTPFLSGAAGFLTVADPRPVYHVDFRTDPFVPVGASFFMAVPGIFHVKAAVFGAGGIAISVIADLFKRTLISRVIGDQGFGEMEFILEETVSFD